MRRITGIAVKWLAHHPFVIACLALLCGFGIFAVVQARTQQPDTPASIQRFLAEAEHQGEREGIQVATAVRIGSYAPSDQISFYFYVVRLEGKQSGYVTLAFTLDSAGEIVRVE